MTDVIGTSPESWEDAAWVAVKTASQTLRDPRGAEVVAQDIHLGEDGSITYRTKLRLSFKTNPGSGPTEGRHARSGTMVPPSCTRSGVRVVGVRDVVGRHRTRTDAPAW